MNPYLEHEDAWHNFHVLFPAAVVAQLNPQVGPNYYLKCDEHVYIHELPAEKRWLWGKADVFLGRTTQRGTAPEGGTATATSPRGVLLPMVERVGLPFVEIRDRRGRRLVTVIELLSPSNKQPGADRDQYETKRAEILSSQAHFVEIDLLRGWRRMPFAEDVHCDYCVLVSRYPQRPRADLWTTNLADPLPPIPIPLSDGEPEAQLDLQAIIHHLHDVGGFDRFIYESRPVPPLPPQQAAWAYSLIPPGAPRHP
jgi:hypothetical protein